MVQQIEREAGMPELVQAINALSNVIIEMRDDVRASREASQADRHEIWIRLVEIEKKHLVLESEFKTMRKIVWGAVSVLITVEVAITVGFVSGFIGNG